MFHETEHLPCPLTDEEWAERSDRCARALAERDSYAERAKAAAKAAKDELAEMDQEIRALSAEIRDRRAWREVRWEVAT